MNAKFEELIPKSEWAPFMEGRKEEFLQPLMDLGYLPLDEAENGGSIHLALATFRKECVQIGWLNQLFDLPTQILVVDGDFQIKEMPVEGEVSIITRVIHYRFRALGLLNTNHLIDDPFSNTIFQEAIQPIKKWLHGFSTDQLSWINLAGDIPKLLDKVWEFGKLEERVVCFEYNPTVLAAEVKQEVEKENANVLLNDKAELKQLDQDINDMEKEASEEEIKFMNKVVPRRTRRRQNRADKVEGNSKTKALVRRIPV